MTTDAVAWFPVSGVPVTAAVVVTEARFVPDEVGNSAHSMRVASVRSSADFPPNQFKAKNSLSFIKVSLLLK